MNGYSDSNDNENYGKVTIVPDNEKDPPKKKPTNSNTNDQENDSDNSCLGFISNLLCNMICNNTIELEEESVPDSKINFNETSSTSPLIEKKTKDFETLENSKFSDHFFRPYFTMGFGAYTFSNYTTGFYGDAMGGIKFVPKGLLYYTLKTGIQFGVDSNKVGNPMYLNLQTNKVEKIITDQYHYLSFPLMFELTFRSQDDSPFFLNGGIGACHLREELTGEIYEDMTNVLLNSNFTKTESKIATLGTLSTGFLFTSTNKYFELAFRYTYLKAALNEKGLMPSDHSASHRFTIEFSAIW